MAEADALHEEREFRARTDGGELAGWLRDGHSQAPGALLLHGGPGLSEYLEPLADELDGLFPIARYQQRGLAPSVTEGERSIERHVSDAKSVLDALGWEKALIVGHSSGGHLAMYFAVSHPERTHAVVAIDPLGAVGDGGQRAFGKNLRAGLTKADLERLAELASLESPTSAESDESLRILWPNYFAQPELAPPLPPLGFDPRSDEAWLSIHAHLEARTLEVALANLEVAFVVIHGEKSPIPISAAEQTGALVPGGRLVRVANSGHWPWLERPGLVRAELQRLVATDVAGFGP
jgi:proline iminopeptidase